MHRLLRWLIAAVVLTVVFGTIYVVMQQSERQGANDAPARLASQIASQLRSANTPNAPKTDNVRLEDSDALFYIVYNAHNQPQSGTGRLRGSLPVVPSGVIDTARATSSDRVTWQPSAQLRFAIVANSVGRQVVVAGQSLIPTEQRINEIGLLIGAAWALTMLVLGLAYAFDRWLDRKPAARK